MTTLLTLPANGSHLMFNGYMSPFSYTGHDWMEDAVYVMEEDSVTQELVTLVDDYLFNYGQLNKEQYPPVVQEGYRNYIQKELDKQTKKLLSLGYTVKVEQAPQVPTSPANDSIEENPPVVWDCLVHSVSFTEKCPACVEEQEEYKPLCEHCSANVIQGLLCHEHGCPAKHLSERGQISVLYMSITCIMTGIIWLIQSPILNKLSILVSALVK